MRKRTARSAAHRLSAAMDTAHVTGMSPSLRDRLRAALAPPIATLLPRPGSILEWPSSLLPFQLDGVRVLLSQAEVLLADDMGLGKTVQAIAALRILLHRNEVESALVVAPASLIHQWRQELSRWAPELRVSTVAGTPEQRGFAWSVAAHVFLITYETLRSDFAPYANCGPRRRTWGAVILDEAQKIKNRNTGVSTSCKMLPRHRSWALTGTPLENKVDDLVSILEFLQPNPGGEPVAPLHFDPTLAERHRDLQLRRRKKDVLPELPPKTVIRVLLDLSEEQMRSYRRAEEDGVLELRQRGETIQLTHVLQLITRLKQICNFCPDTGVSAKVNDLRSRLAVLASEDHRVLVFSQYTDDVFGVRAIERGISRHGPLMFTGDLSQEERKARIAQFKRDKRHRALILSLRAGGQGLNLQEASYVVHFDRWWNPAIERQAEDRSHRMGQT
ncbi:MAG: DEAD/DEAH box helicase, partial [Actinobacteria bacterium]|nr:DEAD/DEAH box helicase [Actinomycetota bacterium]